MMQSSDVNAIRFPEPILDSHPDWVAMYHAAWKIGVNKIKHGTPANGFAPSFIDAAFSNHLFQWDTCLMALFMRYAPAMPTLPALDNFYGKQHADGFICRELVEADGRDYFDKESDQAINPPLFAWAEWAIAQVSGDLSHAIAGLPKLVAYFEWIKANRKVAGEAHGLLWQSNLGSGMDNSPREARGWVCLTAQQALAAECIAAIAARAGDAALRNRFQREYRALVKALNERSWSQAEGYYWDVFPSGRHSHRKTIAAFWPLLAGVPSPAQAERMADHLRNPSEFWRPHVFPSLSRDEQAYEAKGLYWLGGVWAPTNYMVIKGLQRYGMYDLAREASENHIANMAAVHRDTGTIWENYAPELPEAGNISRKDFVGWSGLGPIALLIEAVIGIRTDALNNTLHWHMRNRAERHGIQGLRMAGACIDLLAEDGKVRVKSDAPFTLKLHGRTPSTHAVPAGESIFD
jgi:glycogen debranching enzyme